MALELVETIAELRARVLSRRSAGLVGFVPTMGALHDGHGSLIRLARLECATVVVSIFVNPIQFDRPEDLTRYPRSLDVDAARCASLGVDLVFAPSVAEMYPMPLECRVEVGRLADHLCGRFRPGHFSGVATVVLKLFDIVKQDRAYFGEKDAQQLAVVRRLVVDFNIATTVIGVPTVREGDGLALSSRNQRLDSGERQLATALFHALQRVKEAVGNRVTNVNDLRQLASAQIPADPRLRLEYFDVVDPVDFQPVERVTGPVVAAGALWVGTTRLIDNMRCVPGESTLRSVRPSASAKGFGETG
jgi:pantoate--beta-alanine ligase